VFVNAILEGNKIQIDKHFTQQLRRGLRENNVPNSARKATRRFTQLRAHLTAKTQSRKKTFGGRKTPVIVCRKCFLLYIRLAFLHDSNSTNIHP
jgi:hypothetical protein